MLNQCNFIGRVAKEVDTRYTASGDAVTSLTLAVNETWKDKNGEKKESVEWVNVVLWRKLGEIAANYVQKSDLLHITGKMKTRKWTDKDNKERYSTEIQAESMVMLGGNKGSKGDAKGGGSGGAPRDEPGGRYSDEYSDDIPFACGPSFYDHR